MISFFKYTGSVYLVLEYASQGDLHSYLLENGPITSPLHIRFVLGEVISALSSIHEAGFVFNDLKPENVCITELGHIKLTDFGACRAYNSNGEKALLKSKNSLHSIRNGDWRNNTDTENRNLEESLSCKEASSPDITNVYNFTDNRVEGTPAYLPLEVLCPKEADFYETENNMTSLLVDTWSLGCVAYFCYHGRPLFYGNAEQVEFQIRKKFEYFDTSANNTFQKSVSFKFDETAGCMNNVKRAVHKEETDTISETELRSLFIHLDDSIRLMLTLNPRQRPYMHQIAKLPFFTYSSTLEETNIYTFHRMPPVMLPKNTVNGTNNSREWSRRQFSHIWLNN
jgi:serine/threonine protein kinase